MQTFVDIFAGIGGFRVALEKRGLRCVFSSEIDKHAAVAYEAQFGERPAGDITSISGKDIPAHDVLCAGFPCQSFSISGKHEGLAHGSGKLFYEVIRIAKHHQPKLLLLENVKNILTVQDGRVMETVCKLLDEAGYKVNYFTLNASEYGIAQARQRVYFVCTRVNLELPTPSLPARRANTYLEAFLEDSVEQSLFVERQDIVITSPEPQSPHPAPIRIGYLNKGGQGERIYSTSGHAITLSANGGGVGARTGLYLVRSRVRKLSQVECKRLMGFSDDHVVSAGIQGYKQLGNAAIPAMVGYAFDSVNA